MSGREHLTVEEMQNRIDAQQTALDAAREALQKIASRGKIFDPKGTWSEEVNRIALAALERTTGSRREAADDV